MLSLQENALSNRVVLDSTNVDEVRSEIGHFMVEHEIQFSSSDTCLHAVLKRARLSSFTINVVEYGCDVIIAPNPIKDFYLLHINLSGRCEITHQQTELTVDTHRAALCSPDEIYRFHWHPDSKAVAIQIPRERLLAHARQVLGQQIEDDIEFDLTLDLESPEGQALIGLVQYMFRDAELDKGLTSQASTAKYLEDALIDALFRMQPGNYHKAMHTQSEKCKVLPFHVRRAEQFMAENLDRPVRVSELAEITGVTTRTLSSNFNHFLGDSPARYFLNMRLARARSMLLDSSQAKRVSDVAHELGFSHQSGFAAAYRARFHETPTQTQQKGN